MQADFKDVMSKRTDEELKKRNIDTATIGQAEIDLIMKNEKQKELKAVGSFTRFIHFIVDTIAFSILPMIATYILGLFIKPTDSDPPLLMILGGLMLAVGFFVYYIFMETKYKKTLGKFITKTRVITIYGKNPEFIDIVKRTLWRLIPYDRFSFLHIPTGLHDILSETIVVKDRR